MRDTASSRRARSSTKPELSLLGFVIGVVRVAAGRSTELPSLHQRVETFIHTHLVNVVAARDTDDDITVAARQPIVAQTMSKWKECVRACFIQYCAEEDAGGERQGRQRECR